MPVCCTFTQNNQQTFVVIWPGVGTMRAFSGRDVCRDNPTDVGNERLGPTPT